MEYLEKPITYYVIRSEKNEYLKHTKVGKPVFSNFEEAWCFPKYEDAKDVKYRFNICGGIRKVTLEDI